MSKEEGASSLGALRLPWLDAAVDATLAHQRGHATLLHASPGIGAFEFGLELARGWLCEGVGRRPCGTCGSCRLIEGRVHPDLFVLLPEIQRRERGWPLGDDKLDGEDAKRKPSRQIKIEAVRALIDWSTKTSARGRGKVALLHPAEAINLFAASALLKTLEEPPGGTRLILTAADPSALLPTVLSRCQRVRLPPPSAAEGTAWLAARSVALPEALLAGCVGRPLDAWALAQAGVDGAAWAALPGAVARGQTQALSSWPVPTWLDALHKLCHDAMARCVGGSTRYFAEADVPKAASLEALLAWARELDRVARHADHPWNEGLLLDALVGQGRQALAPGALPARERRQGADTLSS